MSSAPSSPPGGSQSIVLIASGAAIAVATLLAGLSALFSAGPVLIGATAGGALAAFVYVAATRRAMAHTSDAWAVTCVAAGIFVGGLGGVGYEQLQPSPSGLTTLDDVKTEAQRHGMRLVDGPQGRLTTHLRSPDETEYVLTFRPISDRSTASDVLKVLEVVGKKLRPVLSFQPTASKSREQAYASDVYSTVPKATQPAQLSILVHPRLHNLDGRDGDDLVFDIVEPIFGLNQWPTPTLLRYVNKTYRVVPILSAESVKAEDLRNLLRQRGLEKRDAARFLISQVYANPQVIRDAAGKLDTPPGYSVEAYVCRRDQQVGRRAPAPSLDLTAGYVVRSPVPNVPTRLQVVHWRVNLANTRLSAVPDVGAGTVRRVRRGANGVVSTVRSQADLDAPRCFG